MNPCSMVSLSVTKGARVSSGVKTVSSINDAGKIGQIHEKRNEPRPPSYTI